MRKTKLTSLLDKGDKKEGSCQEQQQILLATLDMRQWQRGQERDERAGTRLAALGCCMQFYAKS